MEALRSHNNDSRRAAARLGSEAARSDVARCWETSDVFQKLMLAKEAQKSDDCSGDVVFAMFLEPHEPIGDTPPGVLDRLITFAVQHFQPSPAMTHVELIVPPPPKQPNVPLHFATYIGEKSNWQADAAKNENYYLKDTAFKWRAVPVFGPHAARHVRNACNDSVGVEYSMMRYVTAAPFARRLSALVPDGPRAPAHCATLTARVLRRALGSTIDRSGAYYGPATLYAKLCTELAERRIGLDDSCVNGLTQEVITTLLHKRDTDVQALSEEQVMCAVRVLTLKVAQAQVEHDRVAQTLTQKQLATALLRWSVSRESVCPTGLHIHTNLVATSYEI